MSATFAAAHVPWVVKPLYGFTSDTFPLPFPGAPAPERRRPYQVLCGAVGAAGLAAAPGGFLGSLGSLGALGALGS